MTVIIFIAVLVVLILVHELGHFIVAKKSGIRVDEFGIGFPPKLFSFKKGETEYSINALPLGGFVRIFGENPDKESNTGEDSSRSFSKKPLYIQAMVLVAGVVFNMLLAWVLFSVIFMIGMPTVIENAPKGATVSDAFVVVADVVPNTPAYEAGLVSGDKIRTLTSGENFIAVNNGNLVQIFIQDNPDLPITISYERGGEERTASIVPVKGIIDDRLAIGITMANFGNATLPPHLAILEGARLTMDWTKKIFFAFIEFFQGIFTQQNPLEQITGPVGIAGIVGEASKQGFVYLMFLTALISINLAIINLIPFPALDGGRLLFLFIEFLKGSPIPPIFTNVANTIGFILLILLLLFVTYNDILRIVTG